MTIDFADTNKDEVFFSDSFPEDMIAKFQQRIDYMRLIDYIGLNVHPVSLSNVQPLSDSNVHVYDSVTCVRKGSINFLISV